MEECKGAGLAGTGLLGAGILRTGGVEVHDWNHTPCGCFLWVGDNAIHFDTGSTNCVASFAFEPVCGKKFGSKCPAKQEVQWAEECCAAGLAATGWLGAGNLRNGAVVVHDWNHTPCGCFLWAGDNAIHFDTGSTNCVASLDKNNRMTPHN